MIVVTLDIFVCLAFGFQFVQRMRFVWGDVRHFLQLRPPSTAHRMAAVGDVGGERGKGVSGDILIKILPQHC